MATKKKAAKKKATNPRVEVAQARRVVGRAQVALERAAKRRMVQLEKSGVPREQAWIQASEEAGI